MFERLERLSVGRAGALCRAFTQLGAAHLASGESGKVAHGEFGCGAQLLIAEKGSPALLLLRLGRFGGRGGFSGFSRFGGHNSPSGFCRLCGFSPEKAQVQSLLFGAVLRGTARAHPQASAWCPSASEEMRSSDHSP